MFKKAISSVLAHAAEMHFRKGVEAAFDLWIAAVCRHLPDEAVKLYAEDAILYATLNPIPMTTQEERLGYFRFITSFPGMKVAAESQHLRMFGDTLAVVSGLYNFEYFNDNRQNMKIPARYSMVFKRISENQWLIIDHHSSSLPDPTADIGSSSKID